MQGRSGVRDGINFKRGPLTYRERKREREGRGEGNGATSCENCFGNSAPERHPLSNHCQKPMEVGSRTSNISVGGSTMGNKVGRTDPKDSREGQSSVHVFSICTADVEVGFIISSSLGSPLVKSKCDH